MNKLKDLRMQRNLTQSDIAKILGVSSRAIGLYENGERDIPTDFLVKLAKYFNCSTDYILGIEKPLEIAASTKNGIDLSDISQKDKEAILRIIEMAKNNTDND